MRNIQTFQVDVETADASRGSSRPLLLGISCPARRAVESKHETGIAGDGDFLNPSFPHEEVRDP